jgi:hypothetical protein
MGFKGPEQIGYRCRINPGFELKIKGRAILRIRGTKGTAKLAFS